jgi:hypothetical protein
MITDAELFELEILLIDKFDKFDFSKLKFDFESELVFINNTENGFKDLIELYFNDRIEVLNNKTVISFDIFKILQLRYFRNNRTVPTLN